jgi:hypothetical protein
MSARLAGGLGKCSHCGDERGHIFIGTSTQCPLCGRLGRVVALPPPVKKREANDVRHILRELGRGEKTNMERRFYRVYVDHAQDMSDGRRSTSFPVRISGI